MKKICAITMARDDNFFLHRWIEYYGSNFGRQNLYILLDGLDQAHPNNSDDVSITNVERKPHLSQNGKNRAKQLSNLGSKLLDDYDIVICCDTDEFLVLSPDIDNTLSSYLSEKDIKTSLSALGLDVGHRRDIEKPLDNTKPFLEQRSYALISPRYTKPIIANKKVRWGAGLHRIKGKDYTIDNNLFLFHFGVADRERLEKKSGGELAKQGWSGHMKRQFKIMDLIENATYKDWNKYIPIARFMQRCLRTVYAINKPSMWFYKIVVKIPDAFKTQA